MPGVPDPHLIQGYGEGGFRVRGVRAQGSILLLPDSLTPWSPASAAEIEAEACEPLCAAAAALDLMLIGTGASMRPLPAAASAALKACGLAFEAMATGAACRTYNVLLSEGRRVGAALIAVR